MCVCFFFFGGNAPKNLKSSAEEKGGGARTNYQDTAMRKRARDPGPDNVRKVQCLSW